MPPSPGTVVCVGATGEHVPSPWPAHESSAAGTTASPPVTGTQAKMTLTGVVTLGQTLVPMIDPSKSNNGSILAS